APTPLRPQPSPEAVAVVHDADSSAASFLRDALLDGPTWPRRKASYQREHGTRERELETWLRLFEDCGFEPGSLSLAALDADCARRFVVLVLPELLVLDEEDVLRLADYVESGGTLVIDGTLGWVDRAGRRREPGDVRARLARSHPERVLDAPKSAGGYLE